MEHVEVLIPLQDWKGHAGSLLWQPLHNWRRHPSSFVDAKNFLGAASRRSQGETSSQYWINQVWKSHQRPYQSLLNLISQRSAILPWRMPWDWDSLQQSLCIWIPSQAQYQERLEYDLRLWREPDQPHDFWLGSYAARGEKGPLQDDNWLYSSNENWTRSRRSQKCSKVPWTVE